MRWELNALTKSGKTLGTRSFYNGDTDVMIMSVCMTAEHSQLGTSLADSIVRQIVLLY